MTQLLCLKWRLTLTSSQSEACQVTKVLSTTVCPTSTSINSDGARVYVVFRPGVEYVYRYESEALTGIRSVSDQLTGVKVRSTVKVQFHRDGTWLLKVSFFT